MFYTESDTNKLISVFNTSSSYCNDFFFHLIKEAIINKYIPDMVKTRIIHKNIIYLFHNRSLFSICKLCFCLSFFKLWLLITLCIFKIFLSHVFYASMLHYIFFKVFFWSFRQKNNVSLENFLLESRY